MTKTIFDTSILRLMVLLLPMALRKTGMMSLLEALGVPLTKHIGDIKTHYEDIEHRALYNGQVCRMEMLLNDKFDESVRGIRIVDGDMITAPAYCALPRAHRSVQGYPKRRGQPDGQILLPNRLASQHVKFDFTVVLPSRIMEGMTSDEEAATIRRLTALVNTYKLPGTRWEIQRQGNVLITSSRNGRLI
jgi:hypothetical protein